jgi:hypothetical protein
VKRRVSNGMKGARRDEASNNHVARSPAWHREVPSRSRDRKVMRRNRMAAKRRAVTRSNPDVASLIHRGGRASSLGAKAACTARRSTEAMHSPGVAGTARRDRNALNAGDLARGRGWTTEGTRPRAEASRSDEESDESVVPVKVVKAAGGKGLCSKVRPQRERRGDCGNAKNS